MDGSGSSNEFMSIVAREYFAGMNCITLPLIRLDSDFSAGLAIRIFGDLSSRPGWGLMKGCRFCGSEASGKVPFELSPWLDSVTGFVDLARIAKMLRVQQKTTESTRPTRVNITPHAIWTSRDHVRPKIEVILSIPNGSMSNR